MTWSLVVKIAVLMVLAALLIESIMQSSRKGK